MTSFIYPVVVAWTWGYGWLGAGAGVEWNLSGRFEKPEEFTPHSLPLVVLGTFILWFGWYGFNCGSTLQMDAATGELAAHVAMNTTIAAATGGIVALVDR